MVCEKKTHSITFKRLALKEVTEPHDSQLEFNELKVNKALHPPYQTLPAPYFPQLASQYNPNPHPTLTST